MRKKIMILGASGAQINLINEAKKLGYYIIVVDGRDSLDGCLLADMHYKIDYMQKEDVLKIAMNEKIDGIISNSEGAMVIVSYVVDKLNLPGNSLDSVNKLLSKTKFRELQKQSSVFYPKNYLFSSVDQIDNSLANIEYPILVKPVQSSGTRGVTKISEFNITKIKNAFNKCQSYSRNRLVSIEEYVEMPSLNVFQADVFVYDGKILWDGLFTTKRSKNMPFVPMTHIFPCVSDSNAIKKLKETVNKVIINSGIKLGELNVEAYLTKQDEIFIIEINARQGGNHIPELIYKHSGINLTKLLVSLSVDDKSYYNKIITKKTDNRKITLHMVFPEKSGIYKGIYVSPLIQKFIISEELLLKDGDYFNKESNAEDVVAYYIFEFKNIEEQRFFSLNMEKYIYAIVK